MLEYWKNTTPLVPLNKGRYRGLSPLGTKCLGSACIPLFILFLLLSGCTTFGGEKKGVSDLYSTVAMLVQQNEILEASIVERDKMMVELSVRLNKLADKLKTVLAEKKELEKRIEMRETSP